MLSGGSSRQYQGTSAWGGLDRRVLPPSEPERSNSNRRYRRHETEARHSSRQHRDTADTEGYGLNEHHRRDRPSAWRQPTDNGWQHLETYHPRTGLQPSGRDERRGATGRTAVGRRTRRRGGRQQRGICRDPEGTGLADVRLRRDGGRRDTPSAADAPTRGDACQREHRVSDQQRALRLQPVDGGQPERLCMECPIQRQDGTRL